MLLLKGKSTLLYLQFNRRMIKDTPIVNDESDLIPFRNQNYQKSQCDYV